MLLFEDKDYPIMLARKRRPFRPMHERLRLYFEGGGKREAAWKWRGSMFAHNKRRKPLRALKE
jgi:hypothetical protein